MEITKILYFYSAIPRINEEHWRGVLLLKNLWRIAHLVNHVGSKAECHVDSYEKGPSMLVSADILTSFP